MTRKTKIHLGMVAALVAILIACAATCPSCDELRGQANANCRASYGFGSVALGMDCVSVTMGNGDTCGLVKGTGTCSNPNGGPTLPAPIDLSENL